MTKQDQLRRAAWLLLGMAAIYFIGGFFFIVVIVLSDKSRLSWWLVPLICLGLGELCRRGSVAIHRRSTAKHTERTK